MFKRILLLVFALLLVVGTLAAVKYLQIRTLMEAGSHRSMPPAVVTTAEVLSTRWQQFLEAVGSLTAVQGVMVAAELPGKVVEIAFEPGAQVRQGDRLLRLDTALEEARLSAAETGVDLARINLERARELVVKKSMSRANLDTMEAEYKQALALVEEIRATIDKKTITAPFAGRLGIRLVNLGQILSAGDAIVELQALDPLYVNFSLPQQDLDRLAVGLEVRVSTELLAGEPLSGRITTVNPAVDTSTRNVRVQAVLDNPGERLRPGMFVRARVLLPLEDAVLVIPATAILAAPYGDSVFVVEEKKDTAADTPLLVLRRQVVRTGRRRGDFVAVTRGLAAGQTVVTTGVFKLRNGQAAVVDNRLSPQFSETPKVEDQ